MTVLALPDEDGVRVLRAQGVLDVLSAPPLLPDVPGLVAGVPAVVLDLSAVSFFDSSAVRLVDLLARSCAAAGAGFRIAAPPGGFARRVLELVGMAGPLVCDDVASAVRQVQPVT